MSFFSDNQEFIIGKLYPIAKYSGSDKEMYYNKVRAELYERVDQYYNSVDKARFYNEVIHFVGEWELENLVLNLFLEKDLEILVNNVTIKKSISYSFKSSLLQNLFHKYLVNNETFKLFYFSLDLLRKSEIMDLSQEDWNTVDLGKHPLVRKFSEFLNASLLKSSDVDLYDGYLVLVYAWSLYKVMNNPFNNIKAILLYNSLNEFSKKNDSNELFRKNFIKFIDSIDEIEKYSFVKNEKVFFPFTKNLKDEKYRDGLRLQSEKLCYFYNDFATQLDCKAWSFAELANELNNLDSNLEVVVKKEFFNRININNYPQVEVLDEINDFDILKKTYRFERFE